MPPASLKFELVSLFTCFIITWTPLGDAKVMLTLLIGLFKWADQQRIDLYLYYTLNKLVKYTKQTVCA